MICTVSRRCSPSRRRSAPLTAKRSCRRERAQALGRRRPVRLGRGERGARRARTGSAADRPARTAAGARRAAGPPAPRPGTAARARCSRWCTAIVMNTVLPPPRRPVTASRSVRSQREVGEVPEALLQLRRRGQAGQVPEAGPGEPARHQAPTLPARIARQTSRPSSRLLRKRRRQERGSSSSRVRICQAKWPATREQQQIEAGARGRRSSRPPRAARASRRRSPRASAASRRRAGARSTDADQRVVGLVLMGVDRVVAERPEEARGVEQQRRGGELAGRRRPADQRAPVEGDAEEGLRPPGDPLHQRIDHDQRQRAERERDREAVEGESGPAARPAAAARGRPAPAARRAGRWRAAGGGCARPGRRGRDRSGR